MDGISLTHGTSPRQHIWTFAAASERTGNSTSSGNYCPCQNTTHPQPAMIVPPFVGEDYFCDAAADGLQTDKLWTSIGTDCLCCGNRSHFYKQLPQPTTDDIEMRVCKDEDDENIGLEYVLIYVR